jgi:hypothetical protein
MFYPRTTDSKTVRFLRDTIQSLAEHFDNYFAGDNMILFDRALGFRDDKKFMRACAANAQSPQEKSLVFRLNTLVWAAKHALNVEGDFVECGVWRGFCSSVITDYLDFGEVPKKLYLYDSFEGKPADEGDRPHSPELFDADLHETVVNRFEKYPNVEVVKGVVPQSFEISCPDKISFLHLDLNSAKSEIAALEVLFDRIVPGGVVVFDDYGWIYYRAQKLAEDKFMAKRGHKILEMATGQGLLIKH